VSDLLLVDSSVWVDHLRGRAPEASRRLAAAIGDGRRTSVRMCEPVAMELIAGASATQLGPVSTLVDGLPGLALDPHVDFRSAGELSRSARFAGRAVRSSVDCLIAAVAIRHGAVLVHRDRDFDVLVEISPLRAERWD
jgi:predicted nucleic acid-binding protein